jgi:frataxin-like iron-binding protein CyaY
MNMLNESDIKAALIDKLIERGMLQNAVLINEMVVANWSRRADIAVVNGKLYAFEIKSDFDSLQRLEGQVSAYLDRFDKVTVVTTRKFANLISEQMPPDVEIWEATSEEGEVSFRVARRGKTKEITCKRTLCGFLLKSEIVSFLRQRNELSSLHEMNRDELISMAKGYSLKDLRSYVLSCLKARYEQTFKAFMRDKGKKTIPENLNSLSKSKLMMRDQQFTENVVMHRQKKSTYAKPLNLKMLRESYGVLPDNMPRTVLIRKAHT